MVVKYSRRGYSHVSEIAPVTYRGGEDRNPCRHISGMRNYLLYVGGADDEDGVGRLAHRLMGTRRIR